MSWKSLVTAGLLCVLASPVFAAPSLSITNGGLDAATGNWIWNVSVTPTATGTPLALEAGFTANGALASVANATPATWDTNTPGTLIFGWETTYGSPLKPEGIQANCTACTVTNTAAAGGHATTVVSGSLNQIFAALGSIDLTSGAAIPTITIQTAGPTNSALTSSVTLSGAYSGSARVAEMNGASSSNYKGFTGVASRTAVAGDADLSNGVLGTTPAVTGADLVILASNLGKPGTKTWAQGDFDGSTGGVGEVSGADLVILASHLGKTDAANIGTVTNLTANGVLDTPGAGAGLGGGSAVPEPASIALIGLALLGSLGLAGRRR